LEYINYSCMFSLVELNSYRFSENIFCNFLQKYKNYKHIIVKKLRNCF